MADEGGGSEIPGIWSMPLVKTHARTARRGKGQLAWGMVARGKVLSDGMVVGRRAVKTM